MEYISGNIFVRQGFINNIGEEVLGHVHNFDHTTYIAKGSFQIDKLDEDGNVVKSVTKKATDGFNWILIEAGVRHKLTALENNSVYHCIYSHRTPQGDIVQEYDGWEESNH